MTCYYCPYEPSLGDVKSHRLGYHHYKKFGLLIWQLLDQNGRELLSSAILVKFFSPVPITGLTRVACRPDFQAEQDLLNPWALHNPQICEACHVWARLKMSQASPTSLSSLSFIINMIFYQILRGVFKKKSSIQILH